VDMTKAVSLASLGGGAIEERFRQALEAVIANIADPNTSAEAVREITLKLRLKPSKSRRQAAATFSCQTKLPSAEQVALELFLGVDA
jgi:hypothetical protein